MDTRPNFLLICTDHWPAQLRRSENWSSLLTPTLDRLAKEGVEFSNMFSECPVCIHQKVVDDWYLSKNSWRQGVLR